MFEQVVQAPTATAATDGPSVPPVTGLVARSEPGCGSTRRGPHDREGANAGQPKPPQPPRPRDARRFVYVRPGHATDPIARRATHDGPAESPPDRAARPALVLRSGLLP